MEKDTSRANPREQTRIIAEVQPHRALFNNWRPYSALNRRPRVQPPYPGRQVGGA